MEAIGQLTGGVAHDFNNLLTVIIGNLDIAQRQLKSETLKAGSKLEGFIKNAMQGARRAASLTSRLLAFSRRLPLDPRPLRVDRLVRGMEDLIRQSLGETIEVEVVNAGGLWRIEADPVQMEATILNLALNSRDAMPNGGKLTIETSNAFLDEKYARQHTDISAGQYVQTAVTDTGTGMSSEGGQVAIYSESGEGTTIKLYLPRFFAEEKEEIDTEFQTQAGDAALGGTILVVEDDDEVRAYLVEVLRELKYRVFDARDASGGLDIFAKNGDKIDLLLTDVVLLGMNGRQLADEVAARKANVKILYMTGYSRNAIVHQGRLNPGVEVIQKPLTQESLSAKIREMFEQGG